MRLPAEVLAAFAALFFAASHVTAKRGLQTTDVIAGLLVNLSAAWLVLLVAVAFDPPKGVTASVLVTFAIVGLIAPGIARWAATAGVDRLGPSIAVPMIHGARPLLAALGAVALLGESLTLTRVAGILAIVAGGWYLSRADAEDSADHSAWARLRARMRQGAKPGISFPLLAALTYAAADIIIRDGLGSFAYPSFAAMVGIGAAAAAWLLAVAASEGLRRRMVFGPGVRWHALSGVLVGLAALSIYGALEVGEVSLVAPIAATQPLIVFLLSTIMLRDLELLRLGTVTAGFAIVAGSILVAG